MQISAPRAFISSMIQLLSQALSPSDASNFRPLMGGATPTVSYRFPASRVKRTKSPGASVSARVLVVQAPFDLPAA